MTRKRSPSGAASKGAKGRPDRAKTARGGKSRRRDRPATAPSAEAERSHGRGFLIVGIGASAGGLEACTKLLENLPPRPAMAFVVVQHLAPNKESILSDLLAKATAMPVREVRDGMAVEPDRVYVIPPNAALSIFHGVLRLLPRAAPPPQHMPVDSFFRSLAEDQGQHAVGIILSGTGTDGSLGIRTIKAAGGIVLAQDTESAKYDGMPRSAAATGAADYILPPDRMAHELVRISRHPLMALPAAAETGMPLPASADDLNRIFLLVRAATAVDFTYYKHSTVLRRIHRRMLLHKLDALDQYVRFLQETPAEIRILYQDLLINVTSFFREPDTFTAIRDLVFPSLLENRGSDAPLRVWVPGCSTGEEAYSLAVCFAEFCEERGISPLIQFFASDVDEAAIEKARQGVYGDDIVQDVSPERLRRFFTRTEQGYQISRAIREQCVFARQDLIRDPPFSRMDLISCRNLMIYFGPLLQKKVLPVLHYALNPAGYLMLGRSESIGEFTDLFALVDKNSRIYARRTAAAGPQVDRDRGRFSAVTGWPNKESAPLTGESDIVKQADSIILDRYGPAGLVINEHMDILQFRGNISPYLKPQPGKASLNLMKMAGEGLAVELRALVRRAAGREGPARKEGVQVRQDAAVTTVDIEVVAFPSRDGGERLFLVIFLRRAAAAAPAVREKGRTGAKSASRNDEVARLTGELASTQQHLRSIIAEHETAVEELKALNEEVQSSNEELQSINEELETSKEELQSTNEELSTVNDELQDRNEEISQSNSDLVNVLSGVEIPILLIGNELQIRRFNASAAAALNLIAGDIGRPLSDIRPNIAVTGLDGMIRGVIDSLSVRQQEVQDAQGRWYSMKIRPYKTVDNRIDGALVTLEDIDGLKRGIQRIKEARAYAEAIVETVREALIILNSDLRVVTANKAYYRIFASTPEATEKRPLFELQDGLWDKPDLRPLLEGIIRENGAFNDFEVDYEAPGSGRRIIHLNARRLAREEPDTPLILLAAEDITARREAEEERDSIYRDHMETLSKVKTLSGMLPICSSCKKIRDDKGYWAQIESYIRDHSEADFSHGICPDCAKTMYPEYFENEKER